MKNKGFTLLVAIVVTSIMLLISFVVTNVALKQVVLSSAGVETQYAFYNADSGMDCALYWDLKDSNSSAFATSTTANPSSTIYCNGQSISTGSQNNIATNPVSVSRIGGGGDSNPVSVFQLNFTKGCAIVKVTKKNNGETTVDSRGYNSCNTSAIKRYERGITITYQGNENTIIGVTTNPVGSIQLSSGSFSFSANQNSAPASQNLTISNAGTSSFDWTATPSVSWCHMSPLSGTISSGGSSLVTISADASATAGSFPCSIPITATNVDNSPQTVSVNYTVNSTGITFRSSANATVTSGNVTVNKPSGTVSGDVMIATIGVRPLAAVVTKPSGWTAIRRVDGANASLITYWKVAGGSEPASYTWSVDTSTGMAAGIMSFTGVDTSLIPVNVDGGSSSSAGSSILTAPSITTTVSNTMLITAYAINSTANWTPPSGMTEAYDIKSVAYDGVATNGISLEANYATQSASGSTGAKVATNDSLDQDSGGSQIIALYPASSVTTNYAQGKTVTSLVAANPPYDVGAPANLTDGSISTSAYNGTADQYYSINLGSLRSISVIQMYLSSYGYSNPNVYTTSWSIEGMNSSGSWVLISSGATTPNSSMVYGYPSGQISQIRVRAQSTVNWLGISEVLAY